MKKSCSLYLLSFLCSVILSGCGSPTAPTPPPSIPLHESGTELIEISYDGTGCTASGPEKLTLGNQSFVLHDTTTERVQLYVSIIRDGHTYQDIVDLQSEPGVYYPKPEYVEYAPWSVPKWHEPVDGDLYTFSLNEAGEYAIYVGAMTPINLWFCEPLWVVEAPMN